jgi:hypothetical protein
MAYFHAVASPNEVQFSPTLYYRIKIASRKNEQEEYKKNGAREALHLTHRS